MKNIILQSAAIFLLVAMMVSCGSNEEKDSIKQQIKEYKNEVSQLNIKIKELEQQLEELGDGEEQFFTPVKITSLQHRPFNHYFQVSGTVDADKKAFISPEINGQVKEILVAEGEYVKKGQLLA
ncbi:MAG: biotin/lipoyl-binding protein, partial [Bacteroidota bacterium]